MTDNPLVHNAYPHLPIVDNIGIYKIENPKGKVYIGQTFEFDKRMKYYKSEKCKAQPYIHRSLIGEKHETHKGYKVISKEKIK